MSARICSTLKSNLPLAPSARQRAQRDTSHSNLIPSPPPALCHGATISRSDVKLRAVAPRPIKAAESIIRMVIMAGRRRVSARAPDNDASIAQASAADKLIGDRFPASGRNYNSIRRLPRRARIWAPCVSGAFSMAICMRGSLGALYARNNAR